jgi:hypothetical protein
VIVTLKSGAAFDGVLYEQDGQSWVLRNVAVLRTVADGVLNPPTVVDGELIVLLADIDFAQRL